MRDPLPCPWTDEPAPSLPEIWQATLEQVAAQVRGTAMLAQQQARLAEMSPGRAVLRVRVRWLSTLFWRSEPIRKALRQICKDPQLELELLSEESLHG